MRMICLLALALAGCPTAKIEEPIVDIKQVPPYSADRYDDAHPEEAGLKSSTPDDTCEPECLTKEDVSEH